MASKPTKRAIWEIIVGALIAIFSALTGDAANINFFN